MCLQSLEQFVKVDDLSILDIDVSVCLSVCIFIFLYVYLSGEKTYVYLLHPAGGIVIYCVYRFVHSFADVFVRLLVCVFANICLGEHLENG